MPGVKGGRPKRKIALLDTATMMFAASAASLFTIPPRLAAEERSPGEACQALARRHGSAPAAIWIR